MSQQINLYNPIFLKQKKQFSAATLAQALAIVLLGMLAIYGYQLRQNGILERSLVTTDQQLAQRRDQMLKLSRELSGEGRSRLLADEIARTEKELGSRRELLEALRRGVGGEAGGFSPYLAALARRAMPGVWLTGVDIGGESNDLVIRGRALQGDLLPAYIGSLDRESVLAGHSVSELRLDARDEHARYVEFSITLPLGPQAPKAGDNSS